MHLDFQWIMKTSCSQTPAGEPHAFPATLQGCGFWNEHQSSSPPLWRAIEKRTSAKRMTDSGRVGPPLALNSALSIIRCLHQDEWADAHLSSWSLPATHGHYWAGTKKLNSKFFNPALTQSPVCLVVKHCLM